MNKKAYTTPEFSELGSLSVFTKHGDLGNTSDGGFVVDANLKYDIPSES